MFQAHSGGQAACFVRDAVYSAVKKPSSHPDQPSEIRTCVQVSPTQQDTADKLILSTWTDLEPTNTPSVVFVDKLLQNSLTFQGESSTKQIRTILQRRGLEI
jgi:hypothetical protein